MKSLFNISNATVKKIAPVVLLCIIFGNVLTNSAFAGYTTEFDAATGTMTITLTDGEDITIGKHQTTGGLAINGTCTGVLASQVKKLIINGDEGDNVIDLTNMNESDFPNLVSEGTDFKTRVFAGDGNDEVHGHDMGNLVYGDGGNDELTGGTGKDWLDGGGDDDFLSGGDGDDYIAGGDGHDIVNGGGDDDTMIGEDGNDIMDGGTGKNLLRGGKGNDDLTGTTDDREVDGGPGADVIIIGVGETTGKSLTSYTSYPEELVNLASDDMLMISDSSGVDTLSFALFTTGITLDLDLYNSPQIYSPQNDTLSLYGIFEFFIGTEYDDVIYIDPDSDVARHVDGGGSEGSDTLYVDGMGQETSDDGHAITVAGYQPIGYENIDHCVVTNATTVWHDAIFDSPDESRLFQNYPNPFDDATRIKYTLTQSSHVVLKIYNPVGQETEILVDEFQSEGEHEISWQPKGLPGGIYLFMIQAGEFSETRKLTWLK